MCNVGVAFEILEPDEKVPHGWSKATGHGIWDVKMDFQESSDGCWMDTSVQTLLAPLMLVLCQETV